MIDLTTQRAIANQSILHHFDLLPGDHVSAQTWKVMAKKNLFGVSIFFNILFVIGWLTSPTQKLGRLQKDIQVGFFTSDSVMFTLPKGMTVRNASQRGLGSIGQFENERFEVVVTSDDKAMVDYNVPVSELQPFGNLYSSNIRRSNSSR